MIDPAWCRRAAEELAHRVQGLRQQVARFRQLMQAARLEWDDAAARDVFDRYLEPLLRDFDGQVRALESQAGHLMVAAGALGQAEESGRRVVLLAEEIARLRDQAAEHLRAAHWSADRAFDQAAGSALTAVRAKAILASIQG
jgi:hypothetical protein